MTAIKRFTLFLCLVVVSISYGQRPEDDLQQHSNATLAVEEPEVCLSQSLNPAQNLSERELENGIMLKWKPVPVTFGCQIKGGIVGKEESTKFKEGYELERIYYSFRNLEPLTEYKWQVRCACKMDPLTWGPYSDYKYFTTPDFSTPVIEEEDLVQLFPNPTNGELNLHYNKAVGENSFITIYGVNGNIVKTIPLRSGLNLIDTTELVKGFYLMLIESMEESKRIPFVKA